MLEALFSVILAGCGGLPADSQGGSFLNQRERLVDKPPVYCVLVGGGASGGSVSGLLSMTEG